MARCKRTRGLEVHHISRLGEAIASNAKVLCQRCHEETVHYGQPMPKGKKKKPFSAAVKAQALKNAGKRCECRLTNRGCH